MIISFASKWAHPGVEAPLGGIHYGRAPHSLQEFVAEQEYPQTYNTTNPKHHNEVYYAPYQHHFTLSGLEPNTTYYYVPVVGKRSDGAKALELKPLRDHWTQHSQQEQHGQENLQAENNIRGEEDVNDEEEDTSRRQTRRRNRLFRRRLAPPPYNGSDKPCAEGGRVRSFTTAPAAVTSSSSTKDNDVIPVKFAIMGDLGQFDHSRETLEHLSNHSDDIDAVVLVGDIAYTDYDPRRWDTFMDFLDDFSIFDQVPLQIAAGNHDMEKQENRTEVFQAYEYRFRMPRVKPPHFEPYHHEGPLNMEFAPYPVPYDWGNGYYSFIIGPAKTIVINAYASMEPDSPQYNWVMAELESVDRAATPWLLVSIHVPFYNTFSIHHKDPSIHAARKHIEPLLVKHHVNVVFNGHIHAYQRTTNVALNVTTATGPLHITIGAGGRQCDGAFTSPEPEPYIVARDASYFGYGTFEIFNRTHAEWKWIPLSPSNLHDFNYVHHFKDEHLPSLEEDGVVVENQFFLLEN